MSYCATPRWRPAALSSSPVPSPTASSSSALPDRQLDAARDGQPLPNHVLRSAMSGSVVAIDVGGTACKGALVDDTGRVLHQESRPTGVDKGVPAVVDTIADFAISLAERAQGDVPAAGLVVPGLVDDERGIALYAANLGWRDLPLARLVSERLGRPVALSHDVRTG